MPGDKIIWLGFLTAFLVVLISTPSLIKVAKLKHLVDEPSEDRKLHSRSVPTIGGIVIFGAILFSYALWFPEEYTHIQGMLVNFKYMIAVLILLFFVGVKDDIIGTAPMKKLMAHFVVGFIIVLMADVRIRSMAGIFGIYELDDWQSYFLSLFVYIVIVNAVNLIDGLDGLASGIGFIESFFLGLLFFVGGNVPLALLAFVLCGALLGFLVFNFSPARIFMGDSGSLIIGAIIFMLAINALNIPKVTLPMWLQSISLPVLVMSILVYPLIDTIRVFTIRVLKGGSPFAADKNHIHHRFIALGFNHRGTVGFLYLYNVLVVISVFFIRVGNPTLDFVLSASVAGALIAIPFMFKPKVVEKSE